MLLVETAFSAVSKNIQSSTSTPDNHAMVWHSDICCDHYLYFLMCIYLYVFPNDWLIEYLQIYRFLIKWVVNIYFAHPQ